VRFEVDLTGQRTEAFEFSDIRHIPRALSLEVNFQFDEHPTETLGAACKNAVWGPQADLSCAKGWSRQESSGDVNRRSQARLSLIPGRTQLPFRGDHRKAHSVMGSVIATILRLDQTGRIQGPRQSVYGDSSSR
jgi:hypothetical protein